MDKDTKEEARVLARASLWPGLPEVRLDLGFSVTRGLLGQNGGFSLWVDCHQICGILVTKTSVFDEKQRRL